MRSYPVFAVKKGSPLFLMKNQSHIKVLSHPMPPERGQTMILQTPNILRTLIEYSCIYFFSANLPIRSNRQETVGHHQPPLSTLSIGFIAKSIVS